VADSDTELVAITCSVCSVSLATLASREGVESASGTEGSTLGFDAIDVVAKPLAGFEAIGFFFFFPPAIPEIFFRGVRKV